MVQSEAQVKYVASMVAQLTAAKLLTNFTTKNHTFTVSTVAGQSYHFSDLSALSGFLEGMMAGSDAKGELVRRGEKRRLAGIMKALDPERYKREARPLLEAQDPAAFPQGWDH